MGGDNGYNQFSQKFEESSGKNACDLDYILRQHDSHHFRPTAIGSIFSDEERGRLALCYAAETRHKTLYVRDAVGKYTIRSPVQEDE